jgi:transcriptional regulator with XRE-family HTH domain
MKGEYTMEKKTMGSFISALRRAAGMTQRELGERLFVSDKTVSRCERDECTPDLALIPAIADLFGVTADELLRGERNGATNTPEGEEHRGERSDYQKQKSDRVFHALLERRAVKYHNQSLASVGLALVGLIVAAVINLGFLRAQIAFWASLCFPVGAVIIQLIFKNNAYMRHTDADEDDEMTDEAREGRIAAYNARCLYTAKNVCLACACIFAFCLPLSVMSYGAYTGLGFETWLIYGAGYASVAFLFGYCAWELFVRRTLARRGAIVMNEQEENRYAAERRLLKRSLTVLVAVGAVALVASTVVQSLDVTRFAAYQILDTQAEFVAFAEAEDEGGVLVGHGFFTDIYETPVSAVPNTSLPDGVVLEYEEVLPPENEDDGLLRPFYGRDGSLVFTYTDRRGISRIGLSDSEDGFPVKVYTASQIRRGYVAKNNIVTAIALAYGVFGAVTVAVYVKKLFDLRKRDA